MMDRREHLKLLLAGGVGAGLFLGTACTEEDRRISEDIIRSADDLNYGRNPEEAAHDARLMAEQFFTETEFKMVGVLADIIIPADEESGSPTQAGVPEFIEFMMKDIPEFQLPTRGGLMWLNNQCQNRFEKTFLDCSETERLQVIDDIAWPDDARPEMEFGVRFFNRMRDLTATGFFTTRMGVDYLDYQGNTPGFWDGVPEEVLREHGLEYDQKTLDETIKEEDRYRIAEWDDDMNLM